MCMLHRVINEPSQVEFQLITKLDYTFKLGSFSCLTYSSLFTSYFINLFLSPYIGNIKTRKFYRLHKSMLELVCIYINFIMVSIKFKICNIYISICRFVSWLLLSKNLGVFLSVCHLNC